MKTIIIDGIEYNLTPKVLFKKGDFVVIQETTYLISKIEGINVTLFCNGRECLFDIDVLKNARLWDISKDAKDGDVLCDGQIILLFKQMEDNADCNFVIAHAGIGLSGKLQITNKHWLISNVSKPATKEQRDLLFQKMKEAGYEWDADKKELKEVDNEEVNGEDYGIDSLWHAQRILEKTLGKVDGYQSDDGILEHKCAISAVKKLYEQKPDWNDEDEKIYNRIYDLIHAAAYANCDVDEDGKELGGYAKMTNWFKSLKDRAQPQPKQEWSERDEEEFQIAIDTLDKAGQHDSAHWLESIKDRVRVQPQNKWRPSKEQLTALRNISATGVISYAGQELVNLYNDLKKLRK